MPAAVSEPELREFVARLPKAELHMHIEGALDPDMLLRLARRNGVEIPWTTQGEVQDAYRFPDLQAFLDLYYAGCRVLIHSRDFHEVTSAYLAKALSDGVVRCEMFLSPQAHTRRGVALATMLTGVIAAMDEAADWGLESGLILNVQRQFDESEALELLESLRPWWPRLLGFGLGGPERPHPPSKFKTFFAKCKDQGFKITAHAGEEGPAAYVAEALDVLKVDRIDHGNSALDDPELTARLVSLRTPLTVCPLSNVALHVVPSLQQHPLKAMLAAGLMVTVNSDDPSYFGGYLNDNYVACALALGLGRDELAQIAANSIDASFATPERKAQWLDLLAVQWHGTIGA